MRLTPLDIRKQEFRKGMRGLDGDEVYAFLNTVADEYEAVLNDNKALRERLLELDDKVQEYRNMEKTLRDTLLTAERLTEEAKDTARREADLIIKQAEIDADRGVRSIKDNATQLRQEIQVLRRQRDSYIARMKALAESQLAFIQGAERDFAGEDGALPASDGVNAPSTTGRMPEASIPRPVGAPPPLPGQVAPSDPITDVTGAPSPGASSGPTTHMHPAGGPSSPMTAGRSTPGVTAPTGSGGNAEEAAALPLREAADAPEMPTAPWPATDAEAAPSTPARRPDAGEPPVDDGGATLNAILDRVIERRGDLDPPAAGRPADTADAGSRDPSPGTSPDAEAADRLWSLDKLKRDILGAPRKDGEQD